MGGVCESSRNGTGQPGRPERFGLLAGWGRYPIVVAEALQRQGRQVYCLGVVGHADGQLAGMCERFRWIGLAKLGRAIRFFKRNGVHHATMAGKIHKKVLFRPWFLLRHTLKVRSWAEFRRKFFAFWEMMLRQEKVSRADHSFKCYGEDKGKLNWYKKISKWSQPF